MDTDGDTALLTEGVMERNITERKSSISSDISDGVKEVNTEKDTEMSTDNIAELDNTESPEQHDSQMMSESEKKELSDIVVKEGLEIIPTQEKTISEQPKDNMDKTDSMDLKTKDDLVSTEMVEPEIQNKEPIDIGVEPGTVARAIEARRESRAMSQDELESDPHLTALREAINELNARSIDNLAKKGLWTADTILDSRKFRNPLHTLVIAYISACDNVLGGPANPELLQKFRECLSVLQEHSVDINEGDVMRNTALHLMCQQPGSTCAIKNLLSTGAKVNIENVHQQTALHLAGDNGTINDVDALLEGGGDPNKLDCSGYSPLHYVVKYRRNEEKVKSLVGCGADINIQPTGPIGQPHMAGPTPLHVATKYNRKENVKLLLELGCKTDPEDSSGQTPLHLAACGDTTGVITEYLLQGGASINSIDTIYGETPLHKGIKRNMQDSVRVLTQAGASMIIPDLNGDSPLHLAATSCKNIALWVTLLTSKEADIRVRNSKAQTPLDLARRFSNKVAVNVLKQVEG